MSPKSYIFSMFGSSPIRPMQQHMAKVQACANELIPFFGAALSGDAFARYPDEPLEAVRNVGPVATLLLWLGPINVLLGVFNMVPGFPLDGGRVLRSILWATTGSLERATRWASNVGRGFAWFLIGSGVFMLFGGVVPLLGGGPIQGLWLVLIGWFLNNAAQATYQQQVVTAGLEGVSVRDIMLTRFETVEPEASVALLVRNYVMRTDQRAFPVVSSEGEKLSGLVCLADVRKVPESEWARTHVADVMTSAGDLVAVDPDEPATEALQRLSQRGINQVPVVEHGHIVGLVRRQDIVKWLSLRSGGPGTRLAEAQLRR